MSRPLFKDGEDVLIVSSRGLRPGNIKFLKLDNNTNSEYAYGVTINGFYNTVEEVEARGGRLYKLWFSKGDMITKIENQKTYRVIRIVNEEHGNVEVHLKLLTIPSYGALDVVVLVETALKKYRPII